MEHERSLFRKNCHAILKKVPNATIIEETNVENTKKSDKETASTLPKTEVKQGESFRQRSNSWEYYIKQESRGKEIQKELQKHSLSEEEMDSLLKDLVEPLDIMKMILKK